MNKTGLFWSITMENQQIDVTQMTQILQMSPLGVVVLDAEGKINWVNRKFEQILGLSSPQLMGKKIADMTEVNLTELPDGNEAYQILTGESRDEKWYARSLHPLVSDAANTYTVEYLTDVTRLKSVQVERDLLSAQLQEIAPIDPNSGLLTEKAIMQNVDLLVSRSRRYENPLSVVIMEVGTGKAEADREKVMHSIGQLLKDQMRWADLICRIKTDQFLMVLPETGSNATQKLVGKINTHMDQLSVPYGEGHAASVETHFGLSSWEKGDDRMIMLDRAIKALKSAA